MKRQLIGAALVCLLSCATAFAQQTTGSVTGRVTDPQGAAVPGATVTAKSAATGFMRAEVSDAEGLYRLNALPVGLYDVTAELSGFTTISRKAIDVNVGQIQTIDFAMKVASVAETVNVTGSAPLIETSASSVGGIVDPKTIESMPLNGRQFANLAATIPGVGLGFHSDPTKSTQYSPQIAGGNGRNLNYQIDGGDNNDDTVGGLLQLFPLEAVQEFNLITSRYKAEYGRSNGGVLNVVTKSGTNTPAGSFFELFRDTKLNSVTHTEEVNNGGNKNPYRRNQFGGSFGGPIAKDKAHFFAAVERTQQDTYQTVDTKGLFPALNGTFATPYRENLVTVKETTNVNAAQYLSVRYGYNQNAQPYGVSSTTPQNNWGTSTNKFNSINLNHNWVVAGSKLNEFIFQYADFANAITANSLDPAQSFPNRVTVGQNTNTPQQTQQKKWQFRDDFSWHVVGMGGLGHDLKVGANFINEPRLWLTFNSGTGGYSYTHLTDDVNGPISAISLNGGAAEANTPMKQYATYIQDDFRVSDRLTLNLGFRYDLITGMAIDQTKNPNFVILDKAGKAGALAGIEGFEDFGKDPAEDKNNFQGRAGFAYDVRGDGRDVVRAGYGRYYDFGYTNANILFAAVNATGIGAGTVYSVTNSNGIKNVNGALFKVGDPVPASVAQPNEAGGALPLNSHIASPRIKQPYSDQFSAGWSHQLNPSTAIDIDYVHSTGKDLGWRPALNQRDGNPSGPRHYSVLLAPYGTFSPASFTIDISNGRSQYDGVNFGIRRQLRNNFSLNAWYSLSSANGTSGGGTDELSTGNIQDHLHPFGDIQFGPSGRTDARHRINISGIVTIPYGIQVAPIYRYRSALPVATTEGVDLNQNGANTDIPTEAFAFDGLDANNNPIIKDIGACTTINCGRGASLSTMNLRVSKVFHIAGSARIEAIGEIFNLFNSLNPSAFTGGRTTGTITNKVLNPAFLNPTAFSGDFQQPEQRLGQIGFRFTF
ncbi:MAG TPA: TonB-dependent receptor [Vicinamibacterales bacterium]|nr:TonB-dependent receptor [Vicinamibacterales bacterium]